MGRPGSARKRALLCLLAVSALAVGVLVTLASVVNAQLACRLRAGLRAVGFSRTHRWFCPVAPGASFAST